jgi:hypothetical protein
MKRVMVLTVLAVVVAACGAVESVTDAADELVDESVFSMEVGLCFNDPEDGAEEVSTVEDVDCAEPHDNEVYHVFDVEGDTFPGDEQITVLGNDGCLEPFAAYVGISEEESVLTYYPITPTQGSWDERGDREIVCALYAEDLSKLEGSAKDTAQ